MGTNEEGEEEKTRVENENGRRGRPVSATAATGAERGLATWVCLRGEYMMQRSCTRTRLPSRLPTAQHGPPPCSDRRAPRSVERGTPRRSRVEGAWVALPPSVFALRPLTPTPTPHPSSLATSPPTCMLGTCVAGTHAALLLGISSRCLSSMSIAPRWGLPSMARARRDPAERHTDTRAYTRTGPTRAGGRGTRSVAARGATSAHAPASAGGRQ